MSKSKNQRVCLFCKEHLIKTVRSREHVFPQWLLDELDIRSKSVTAVHLYQPEDQMSDSEVCSERSLTFENIREGRICARCNNGWMSKLEHSCQEILRDMIFGRRRPEQLSESDCLLVARWAAKTAYVLNSSANFIIKVPILQLNALRENSSDLPWGVAVVAATSAFFDTHWFQSTRWQVGAPDRFTNRIAGLMDTRTYKVGVQFGHLVLLVVWHATPGWWKMFWYGQHTVLWPRQGKCGWHFDNDSILKTVANDLILPLHVQEIKLVHPRYLQKSN